MDTMQLKAGMILLEDVMGKSGKPIMEKRTTLTEKHLFFLEKFNVQHVQIVPHPDKKYHEQTIRQAKNKNNFAYEYEHIVKYYTGIVNQMEQRMPLNHLFGVRKVFMPFFETVQNQSFKTLFYSMNQHKQLDMLPYKSVSMSIFAIYAADKIGMEKKDWLQIGYAALFADAGFTKMSQQTRNEADSEKPSEAYRMHPFHSYKIVEAITTLTKQAKIAILQHHERMDGSGYPAKLTGEKIMPYARILSVSDYFVRIIKNNNLSQIIHLLEQVKGVKLDKQITTFFIEALQSLQKER